MTATVAGIDVGGTKKGFHLVILRDREFLCIDVQTDASALYAQCMAFDVRVAGIDAPGGWRIGDAGRSAERDMARERISCFSTPTEAHASASTSGFYEWMFNGLRVYRAFETTHPPSREKVFRGEPACIETFPHAITCALLGRDEASAKQKRTQRKALLETLGFDVSGLKSIDAIDAALCAFTAQLFVEGRTRAFGADAGDYIFVPDIGVAAR